MFERQIKSWEKPNRIVYRIPLLLLVSTYLFCNKSIFAFSVGENENFPKKIFTWSVEYGAAGDALLPIGDERILVGRRRALLQRGLPAAVRIHGIETLRLGGESLTSLAGAQPDHLVFRSDVQSVLHGDDTGYVHERVGTGETKQKTR